MSWLYISIGAIGCLGWGLALLFYSRYKSTKKALKDTSDRNDTLAKRLLTSESRVVILSNSLKREQKVKEPASASKDETDDITTALDQLDPEEAADILKEIENGQD